MSSDNIAISVSNISKVYPLYSSPRDRLKEALHPLRKKYHKDFYALNDVSFEIQKGETMGIIGQNGSGKSTLLKILSYVLTPSSGGCKVKGKVSSLLELGTGFNPELSGIENVYFNGTLLGFSKEEMDAKLDDILSFADIGEFIGQPVKTYSSGMYVRLAFAVAINVNPEVLIIDEALAVGDMRFQQKCFRKIAELRDKGTTILFCTHDTGVVLNLCATCIWIHNGAIKESGEPKDVVKKYAAFMSYEQETKEKNTFDLTGSYSKGDNIIRSKAEIPWTSTLGYSQFGEGGAIITDVAFYYTDFRECVYALKGEEKVSVGIRVTVTENLINPIVGIMFKNAHGVSVFSINTFQENINTDYLTRKGLKENIFFSFTFPTLGNGKYFLDVAIADGTQITHSQKHWVHDVFEFEVFNSGDKYSFGYIYLKNITITRNLEEHK